MAPKASSTSARSTETPPRSSASNGKGNKRNESRETRRKRINWYFVFVRLILYSAIVVVLFSGTLFVKLGAYSLNIFGSVLSMECTTDQAFNNIWRFISVMWLCYAPMCALVSYDLVRYGPVLTIFAVMMFIGGLARFWTAYTIGIPGTPMGYFLVYIATFIDLTTPPFVMLLFTLGKRLEKKRA